MTVQEMIDSLSVVDDKSKELVFSAMDVDGNDYERFFSTGNFFELLHNNFSPKEPAVFCIDVKTNNDVQQSGGA